MPDHRLAVALLGCLVTACSDKALSTIEYRGERIALTKAYRDFDEYKNDTNNIAAFETARVQQLVLTAPIARRFASVLDASRAVTNITFPGYGSGGFVPQRQGNGDTLTGFEVEIPRAGRVRYFVIEGGAGRFRLIDDFVIDEGRLVAMVDRRGDSLVFMSERKVPLFTRPYRVTSP